MSGPGVDDWLHLWAGECDKTVAYSPFARRSFLKMHVAFLPIIPLIIYDRIDKFNDVFHD